MRIRIIDSFLFPFQKTHGEVDSKSLARPILDHRVPVSERIQGNLGTLILGKLSVAALWTPAD